MRSALRTSLMRSLRGLQDAYGRGDEPQASACWKLFLLTPRMLLAKPQQRGAEGHQVLETRARKWSNGEWAALLQEARDTQGRRARPSLPPEEEEQARYEQACALVRLGTPSRARSTLTASPIAPGTEETRRHLVDPARRPPSLRSPLPPAVAGYSPSSPLQLDVVRFLGVLRSARKGSAPGPSGMRAEHLKPLLEDETAMELLGFAAAQLAEARVPAPVAAALGQCRITALRKPNGGIRGIATGDVLRRLVTRTIAQQFSDDLVAATSPFQFALATRAGTDCAAMLLRSEAEGADDRVIVSLDGVGAYDHISRAAVFDALLAVPALAPLVPFVRMWYGTVSRYQWYDDAGTAHIIQQGEGVEQGDALAPALFALGLHRALAAANAHLREDEALVAYLDDVYVATTRARARHAFDVVTSSIQHHAQIDTNLGKCRVYGGAGGPPPPGIAELGPEVWRGQRPRAEQGITILGTPVGTTEYVEAHAREIMGEENRFLQALPHLPDTQCAWLLLRYCASPRANHLLRTVPPDRVMTYARAHDDAMWGALRGILGGGEMTADEENTARALATVPGRLGGLGLQSAARTASAAYWAAWADALPIWRTRRPREFQRLAAQFSSQAPPPPSIAALLGAEATLAREGFAPPALDALLRGEAPDEARDEDDREPGERSRGWQRQASSFSNLHFREHVLLPSLTPAGAAMLRSGSGPRAAEWLAVLPTAPGLRLLPTHCQVALRRRLRLPLLVQCRRCGGTGTPGCGLVADARGDHLAACPRTGLLARRANPVERAWTQIAREGGGRVVHKQLLRDTSVPVASPRDRRQLDMVAYGVTRNGTALCCDATVVSPLRRDGQPVPGAAEEDGVALHSAERRKRERYPELLNSLQARLVVLACEVGGRWSQGCLTFVRRLARQRARSAPALLRTSARQAWAGRWWGMLSVAVQSALAATLCGDHLSVGGFDADVDIPLGDVLLDGAPGPTPSRLPLRA